MQKAEDGKRTSTVAVCECSYDALVGVASALGIGACLDGVDEVAAGAVAVCVVLVTAISVRILDGIWRKG